MVRGDSVTPLVVVVVAGAVVAAEPAVTAPPSAAASAASRTGETGKNDDARECYGEKSK